MERGRLFKELYELKEDLGKCVHSNTFCKLGVGMVYLPLFIAVLNQYFSSFIINSMHGTEVFIT